MRTPGAVAEFVDAYFRFRPDQAVERGYDRHLSRTLDLGPDAVARFRRALAAGRSAAGDLPAGAPGSAAAVDLAMWRRELAMGDFFIDTLAWLEVNPLLYVEPALQVIESVTLRDDLAPAVRRDALVRHLHGIAPLMRQLRDQVTEPVEPYREAALEMAAAGIEQIHEQFIEERPDSLANGDADLARAAQAAARALGEAAEALERAAPGASFQPMGEERFRRLLATDNLMEPDLDELVAFAESTTREAGEALRAARDDDARPEPGEPPPGFGREAVLEYYRRELDAVREFVSAREIVTIPDGRLELRETPPWLEPLIPGASYHPPPAFSQHGVGRFFVRPVPQAMNADQRRYYHESVIRRRFRNLVVHEAYPGHHVQLQHAARQPSAIRKLRDSEMMAEGWALYCEQLMVEQGLFEDEPSQRPLRGLRMRAVRVTADVGIHTGALSIPEAVRYMCDRLGPGARGWVEKEVRRYAAEPTQAMSYLVGQRQIAQLRDEWRDAAGPRFALREFHDRFLAEGSIPVSLIRARMLAAPEGP